VSLAVVVVTCDARTTKDVVTPAEEVMLTGETEKDGVAVIPSLLVAVRVTEPVKPLVGVIVRVMPVEVAPGCTVTAVVAPVHGVREKSAEVEETMSTDASGPFG
jgi:hypothetical protein